MQLDCDGAAAYKQAMIPHAAGWVCGCIVPESAFPAVLEPEARVGYPKCTTDNHLSKCNLYA